MTRIAILISVGLFLTLSLSAKQKSDVLLRIGDEHITKQEFVRIYKKNNTQLNDQTDIKSPEEYMDLFINFKLKVIEAQSKGMDTISSFVNELKGYRKDLAKPYLTDISYNDQLVKDLYQRTISDVKASHILLEIPSNPTPADTAEVYAKAMEIRKDILEGKATFEEMAIKYSTDPSVASNKGDMGYFSAFRMVAPFEDGAFTTPIGEISLPVRTRFGYHLIWVTDKKPSSGEIKVAHIMKQFSSREPSQQEIDQLKNKIDSIYQLAIKGADFANLAHQYSDDQRSLQNDGEMAWFKSGQIVKPFSDAAFSIDEIGGICQPVNSGFGWHIIKKLDWRPPKSFEDSKEEIEKRIKSDPARSNYSEKKFLEKLKKGYNLTLSNDNISEMFQLSQSVDTLTKGEFATIESKVLFSFNNQKYTIADFISENKTEIISKSAFNADALDRFIDETLLKYEDSILEQKHPDFKYLYKEYHDGILLFNIMEQEVWNKAIEDSVGLKNFYENMAEKYTWDKHFDGMIIKCEDESARAQVDELISNGITSKDQLLETLNDSINNTLSIVTGKFEKGDHSTIDFYHFGGEKPENLNEKLVFTLGEIKNDGVKVLNEARGLYISDYQEYLEKEWLKSLKKKYKIKVKKKLLKSIEDLSL